jgi:hypothetical protein
MNLEKILAISGKPGLYVLQVQTRTGFVAESLVDEKKITVNLKSNVSLLSEISIYTYDAEKPLSQIMQTIADKESNGPTISHKEDNATLIAYFKEILPDYDEERVYPSDIKKVLNWYNMLQVKGLIVQSTPGETTIPSVDATATENSASEAVVPLEKEEVVKE